VLPADGHVHSEWSWDAKRGSMEQTCVQALAIGLPAVAFTEHADYTTWMVPDGELEPDHRVKPFVTPEGVTPPEFDLDGYLECVQRCRDQFPDLRIISGVELGEPHWHSAAVTRLLEAGQFDRVLGSLHILPLGRQFAEPSSLYRRMPAAQVVRDYLAEIPRLIAGSAAFSVLAHITFPLRFWPESAGPLDLGAFEEEFRHALRVLAGSSRVLEINTRGPLDPQLVHWWRDEGGTAVTFGSDAHDPTRVAYRFTEATAIAEASGFKPGRHPCDYWRRTG
jgi:histidinol-phosphatase (PHP family)